MSLINKPRIYNMDVDIVPPDAVLVDRLTIYGNPYRIGQDGTAGDVCILYLKYLIDNPQLVADIRKNLRGKSLVCHCSTELCHGSILMLLAG